MKHGYYHMYIKEEAEPVLAKLYRNPDAGCEGFGFNTADGAGFLPISDLTENTKLVPVEIREI